MYIYYIPCSMRGFMREFFNVSLVASHDHSELMRTTTFSHATHSRLHVCTLGHHYDEYTGTERRLAPFILHYIYIYMGYRFPISAQSDFRGIRFPRNVPWKHMHPGSMMTIGMPHTHIYEYMCIYIYI
jgi:hypothetical protein